MKMTTLDAMITMVTHTVVIACGGDAGEVWGRCGGRDATHAVVIAPLECEVPMKLATVMAAVERHEKSATCSQLEV